MGKRKSVGTQPMDDSDDDGQASDHSSGSSAPSLIDVDFDFFPPSPDVDLIALKRLLRQLLYSDSDLLDLHPLAELLLAEALDAGVGSTIKVDGEDSDPFSFMGVINLNLHQVRAARALPDTAGGSVRCPRARARRRRRPSASLRPSES